MRVVNVPMHVLWHIWGAEVRLHLLLTMALDEIEWSSVGPIASLDFWGRENWC